MAILQRLWLLVMNDDDIFNNSILLARDTTCNIFCLAAIAAGLLLFVSWLFSGWLLSGRDVIWHDEYMFELFIGILFTTL